LSFEPLKRAEDVTISIKETKIVRKWKVWREFEKKGLDSLDYARSSQGTTKISNLRWMSLIDVQCMSLEEV